MTNTVESFFYSLSCHNVARKIGEALEVYIEKSRAELRLLEKTLEMTEETLKKHESDKKK